MPQWTLMDIFHVTIESPPRLDAGSRKKAQRVLRSRRFERRLREAVAATVGRFPSLQPVRFTLSS